MHQKCVHLTCTSWSGEGEGTDAAWYRPTFTFDGINYCARGLRPARILSCHASAVRTAYYLRTQSCLLCIISLCIHNALHIILHDASCSILPSSPIMRTYNSFNAVEGCDIYGMMWFCACAEYIHLSWLTYSLHNFYFNLFTPLACWTRLSLSGFRG